MSKKIQRQIFKTLLERIKEPRQFIQVLLGPRQVGKTTMALGLREQLNLPIHYASADTVGTEDLTWLHAQWEAARSLNKGNSLLIIDEVQKVPQWSSIVKKLWDEDTKDSLSLKVILLGSSPWLMQKGLGESLAGRFEILPVTHWSYSEMNALFGWDLDFYIYFGGYPGAAPLADDLPRWLNYINDSLIETTLSRDILLMTQVNKPILLRRMFQLGCKYSSQILSYQKMLGQLDDAGNTTTLAHYLDLLSGAGLITGIDKFAIDSARRKSSSPKLQVFNTALMSAQSGKTFTEAKNDPAFWGRLIESAIGAHLLNGIRGTQIELFYWREKQNEVDFILKHGSSITAIEVKSSARKERLPGLSSFCQLYPAARPLLIGREGISLSDFLSHPPGQWL